MGEAILATGKNVIIIGGGDIAADCLGTCHRQQARSILQLDYNPRPPENDNPGDHSPLEIVPLRHGPLERAGSTIVDEHSGMVLTGVARCWTMPSANDTIASSGWATLRPAELHRTPRDRGATP